MAAARDRALDLVSKGYSLHDVTTNRNVTLAGFDSLQGNFLADVLSMRLEGGYRLPYGVVAVTPMRLTGLRLHQIFAQWEKRGLVVRVHSGKGTRRGLAG